MKKLRAIIVVIAVVALIAVGYMAARLQAKNAEPDVSVTSIEEQLVMCSELATARLDYRGLVTYSDGDIPLINQKSFSMIFDASIKAGIRLEQAKVEVNGKTIRVELPAPEILDITVDSDSLEFYDEQFALFNWTKKEDTQTAIGYARENAEEKAKLSGILDEAKEQAETVVRTMLLPLTENEQYKLEVTSKQEN